jgi:hypothetical protein
MGTSDISPADPEPQVSPTSMVVAAIMHAAVMAGWEEPEAFQCALQMLLAGTSDTAALVAFALARRWVQ